MKKSGNSEGGLTRWSASQHFKKAPLIKKPPPPFMYLLEQRGGFLIRHFLLARRRRKFLGVFGVLRRGNRVENAFPGLLGAAGAKNFRLRR